VYKYQEEMQMRRKDREVKDFAQICEIIKECDTIRLGLSDGEYPYIVPLSFGYEILEEQIYFYIHGAKVGRKMELMQKNKVCSFEMDCAHKLELIPSVQDVTMRYKCLMGKAQIKVLEDDEKQHAMDVIMNREDETRNFEYDHTKLKYTMMARLTVTEYSGKINPIGGNAD
jgi:uncharacterized protein